MSKIKNITGLFLVMFFMLSCSEPTMQEDAQEAAFLSKQSMEFSASNQLQEAESCYSESQKIMDKYRYTDESQHFFDLYNLYLQDYLEEAANLNDIEPNLNDIEQ